MPLAPRRVDPAARGEDAQTARPLSESSAGASPTQFNKLSPEQRRQLAELRTRDREVRAHEAAHQAVAGRFAGPVKFDFQRGPDGQLYATGGQVQVDTSPVPGDLEATIDKMETIRAAALAPGNPSAQDQAVAAQALREIVQARAELAATRGDTPDMGGLPATESAERGPQSPASALATGGETRNEAPPGPARAAALAFRSTEASGGRPSQAPPEVGLFVDVFA